MVTKTSDRDKSSFARSPAAEAIVVIGALIFSLLMWKQGFSFLSNTPVDSAADLAAEHYFIDRACLAKAYWPGWPINPNSTGFALGNFAPNISLYLTFFLSCKLSLVLQANSLQTFLAIGITLTLCLGYIACRTAHLSKFTSLFSAISMATAPCAFSRFGHLSLSQLWPVLPTIACSLVILNGYKSEHLEPRWNQVLKTFTLGCIFGALAAPGQDYYLIFGSALVATCMSWRLSRPKPTSAMIQADPSNQTTSKLGTVAITAGFLSVNLLLLSSKISLWSIPSWAGAATTRQPSEQFSHGFWALALVQSSIFNDGLLKRFKASSLPPGETPFGSSGSILIIIATLIAISTLRVQAMRQSEEVYRKILKPLTSASILLLISLAIALLCTTPGGLGTLFAVYVSPQLRALNRFMPYVYAPAVVVIGLWLESHFSNLKSVHQDGGKQ